MAASTLGRSGHSWILAEHPGAALARDLDRFFEQDLADEGRYPRVLRVKAVGADVEVEVAVMEGPAETADHVVTFDDGDLVSAPRELVADGEPGHSGPYDGD